MIVQILTALQLLSIALAKEGVIQLSLTTFRGSDENVSAGFVLARLNQKVGTVSTKGFSELSADYICQTNGFERSADWFGVPIVLQSGRLRNLIERALIYQLNCSIDESESKKCSYKMVGGDEDLDEIMVGYAKKVSTAEHALVVVCEPRKEKHPSGECKIRKNFSGFLVEECQDMEGVFKVFKCPQSDEYFTALLRDNTYNAFAKISKLCSNDSNSYQSCGLQLAERLTKVINLGNVLCDQVSCQLRIAENSQHLVISPWQTSFNYFTVQECLDTATSNYDVKWPVYCKPGLSKEVCNYVSKHLLQEGNGKIQKCDMICQDRNCIDERYCNNLQYGISCYKRGKQNYVKTFDICNDVFDCDDASDERFCDSGMFSGTPKCYPVRYMGLRAPIFNYTRCGPLQTRSIEVKESYCKNFTDQLNCTDHSRGVLECVHNGFPATVSYAVLCLHEVSLCDDGLDSKCKKTSNSCLVHEHLLCDGKYDCEDGSDETSDAAQCTKVVAKKCFRRYKHHQELPIPVHWLNDGISDCLTDEDEQYNIWPMCKNAGGFRRVYDNSSCDNVYLCSHASNDFIELERLCDGIDDCGEEATVCKAAHQSSTYFTDTISSDNTHFLFHCLPGLSSMELLSTPCIEQEYKTQEIPQIGRWTSPVMKTPQIKVDCNYVYGELYVFLSCLGRCINSSCVRMPVHELSCSNHKENGAITLATNGKLMYVIKTRGKYHNNFYQCKNQKCITFDKLCNLADDCGDQSDEVNCTNSFQCMSSQIYLSREKVCDGHIDCSDHSDECNHECSKEIIPGSFLKVSAWSIGPTAFLMNAFSLIKIFQKPWNRKRGIIMTRVFKTLIHIGDFMVGIYLVAIAFVDSVLVREEYCTQQFIWITSVYCSVLGVISTTGSTISLFSMTLLSILRIQSIRIKTGNRKMARAYLKIGIIFSTVILVSVAISLFPLFDYFEDFFVNGRTYANLILFVTAATKKEHLNVLKAYYGDIRLSSLYWRDIYTLLGNMFSNDYGPIVQRKIGFYGNEGVCLFKYFVKSDDPQKLFVWIVLLLNLTCFLIITVCYSIINMGVKKRRKKLRRMLASRNTDRSTERLERNITIIILTDFMCWIPFILICALHSIEVVDATSLYASSSIIILPINSVINPIIYNHDFVSKKATTLRKRLIKKPPLLNQLEIKQG